MDNDGFPITQPGYNFYEDKKGLTNPAEKTWNQKEEIRKKCEDWLKNVKWTFCLISFWYECVLWADFCILSRTKSFADW